MGLCWRLGLPVTPANMRCSVANNKSQNLGGQSSSGEKKEYFFALALDLIPGLQQAAGSWCQAYKALLLHG